MPKTCVRAGFRHFFYQMDLLILREFYCVKNTILNPWYMLLEVKSKKRSEIREQLWLYADIFETGKNYISIIPT